MSREIYKQSKQQASLLNISYEMEDIIFLVEDKYDTWDMQSISIIFIAMLQHQKDLRKKEETIIMQHSKSEIYCRFHFNVRFQLHYIVNVQLKNKTFRLCRELNFSWSRKAMSTKTLRQCLIVHCHREWSYEHLISRFDLLYMYECIDSLRRRLQCLYT